MEPNDLVDISEEVLEYETIYSIFPLLDTVERQKLYVMKVLKNTRAAYEDMDVFENVVLVLNGFNPDVTKMEGCRPKHIWKSLEIIKDIHPEIEFAHEILLYIKMMCREYGLEFYPPNIGLEEDNNIFEAVGKRAADGPFPLGEDFLGLQAAKLLKINEYLGE